MCDHVHPSYNHAINFSVWPCDHGRVENECTYHLIFERRRWQSLNYLLSMHKLRCAAARRSISTGDSLSNRKLSYSNCIGIESLDLEFTAKVIFQSNNQPEKSAYLKLKTASFETLSPSFVHRIRWNMLSLTAIRNVARSGISISFSLTSKADIGGKRVGGGVGGNCTSVGRCSNENCVFVLLVEFFVINFVAT